MRIGCSPTRSPSAASYTAKLSRGCRQGRPGIAKPAGGGLGRDRCLGQGGAQLGPPAHGSLFLGPCRLQSQAGGAFVLLGGGTLPIGSFHRVSTQTTVLQCATKSNNGQHRHGLAPRRPQAGTHTPRPTTRPPQWHTLSVPLSLGRDGRAPQPSPMI